MNKRLAKFVAPKWAEELFGIEGKNKKIIQRKTNITAKTNKVVDEALIKSSLNYYKKKLGRNISREELLEEMISLGYDVSGVI